MKYRIMITKANDKLQFYLVASKSRVYLFSQEYTKCVYDYFRKGRSANELYKFKCWNRNRRLDKTIEKIPMYMQYVLREAA